MALKIMCRHKLIAPFQSLQVNESFYVLISFVNALNESFHVPISFVNAVNESFCSHFLGKSRE